MRSDRVADAHQSSSRERRANEGRGAGPVWTGVLLNIALWLPAGLIVVAHLVATRILIIGANAVFCVLWLAYILSYRAGRRGRSAESTASRGGLLADVRVRSTFFFVALVVNMLVVVGAGLAALAAPH